jgi:hypothetical protein
MLTASGELPQSLRKERGLTRQQLAGRPPGTVRNNGQGVSRPTLPNAARPARGPGVSLDLLTGSDEMARPGPPPGRAGG